MSNILYYMLEFWSIGIFARIILGLEFVGNKIHILIVNVVTILLLILLMFCNQQDNFQAWIMVAEFIGVIVCFCGKIREKVVAYILSYLWVGILGLWVNSIFAVIFSMENVLKYPFRYKLVETIILLFLAFLYLQIHIKKWGETQKKA